jgi:pilus assembly protein CpaC
VNVQNRIPLISLCIITASTFFGPVFLRAQATQVDAVARRDASRDLSIAVGKTAVIDFDHPVTRVAIGLGEVAEVSAVSPTEILVNGKTAGDTSLIVWEQGGVRQFFNVSVHASHFSTDDTMSGLRREINLELPGENVNATTENGLIFLRGTVKDLNSSDRAVQIASTVGKVVNLLYVDVPPSPAQVLLKVRFCSVDRSLEKQLGINIFSTGAGNTIGTVNTGQYSPTTVSTGGAPDVSNELNLFLWRPDINLGATLQDLETKGLVESLAEPNIIAEDGKQASFLAGGEYPYPMVQGVTGGGAGAVTIEFKEYGIRLNFIPTIMPGGAIRLQLAPEVSSLDFSNAIEVSGFNVPAIDIRRVKTEVELKDGQSFVIGGLLDNTESETFEKIPFLGDIPILGKLFQSIQRTKNNTELIVIVTPVIVPPIPVGQPLPELHYPVKFLPSNSNIPMSNPGSIPAPPQPVAIPVEQLIESQKPEKTLTVESMSLSGGM